MVERRDGLSFVGDLSVHEYLGEELQLQSDETSEVNHDETVESDS